ncbi:MAG TPA: T9SS type A sorting domain-containing protein [Chitinophagaceae bacterium]|nr:T9SS type A sorting domain-containing protein [Chitinophagaceae bacterium]HNF30328.1 T9SS type A sorting domain-containing protein [Chitinophagaceae bacterium]HNJ58781.1 T9SS type A sorting domain-containing protein [Chitinophagaceae bacterium]HNM35375.1 T9SS type A sorting domain-containing protein [Chitinophagaceae bacterium]
MLRFLFILLVLLVGINTNAQSFARVEVGGYYQSFDNVKISAFEPIISEQNFISEKIIFKGGFLFGRLSSILVAYPTLYNYKAPHIIVYPNPAQSNINFYISPVFQVKQVTIFSTQGALVYKGTDQKNINVSHLASGVYFLHILLMDNNKVITRFVKI